jgi:hypothetical protein
MTSLTCSEIEFFEQSRNIAREIGYRRIEGHPLWKMGQIVDKLNNRAEAIALAEAALNIFKEIESPTAEKIRKQLDEWRGQIGAE